MRATSSRRSPSWRARNCPKRPSSTATASRRNCAVQKGQPRDWVFNQLASNVVCPRSRLEAESGGRTFRHERRAVHREARARRHRRTRRHRRPQAPAGRARQAESRRRHPGSTATAPAAHANRQAKSTTPANSSAADRAARSSNRLDKDRTGKLTREQYISSQSDPVAAAKRFEKFDADQDGIVTREEFINGGARKTKSP